MFKIIKLIVNKLKKHLIIDIKIESLTLKPQDRHNDKVFTL
jgi:hypothetical protein